MSHIRLHNLNVAYGQQLVLQNITVDIPDGQLTAIIGPSGCGKTTLLKRLNRLIDLCDEAHATGAVLIDGANIYDPQADILALRKKVGFLSQRPYPLPMSIYDNIAFGPRIHRVGKEDLLRQAEQLRERGLLENGDATSAGPGKKGHEMDRLVEGCLRLAGLWDEVRDRLHTPAAKLSVGQQQRLALARALAVEPDVILADEPISALDPHSAQLVEQQFQLLKQHYTVVVTHILRQARRIADYVLFLYLGELVEHGPTQEIFHAPRNERTQAYVSGAIS